MELLPLHVICEEAEREWLLSFEARSVGQRTLRLAFSEPHLEGSAEIKTPAQISALTDRVLDRNGTHAEPLAEELMDLLLTLATTRPGEQCLEFMRWRMSQWIATNRRRKWESNVA